MFSPRDVFTAQTPAGLARVAQAARPAPEAIEDVDIGEVVLTPVMRWLLERGGPVGRFSQSVAVTVPAGAGLADLDRALRTVISHHVMLRARLEAGMVGGWWYRRRAALGLGWCGGWMRRVRMRPGWAGWRRLSRLRRRRGWIRPRA